MPNLLANFLQRDRVLREQPRPENFQFLAFQRLGELLDAVFRELAEFLARRSLFRIARGIVVGEHIEQPRVFRIGDRLIERHLALRHPLLHLADLALFDAHPLRDQLWLRTEALGLEAVGFLLEVEKSLRCAWVVPIFTKRQLLMR